MIRFKITNNKIQALINRRDKAEKCGDTNIMVRSQALILYFIQKMNFGQISKALGRSYETIRIWFNEFVLHGLRSLVIKVSVGRPRKLTKSQRRQITEALRKKPHEVGLVGGCWSSAMIAELIYRYFNVTYSPKYIPQLMKSMGFSYQKGKFESDHLDSKKRTKWLLKTWKEIQRKSKEENARIFFEDEASFAMWGSLFYTWAPIGEQPVIKTSGKRKGYKMFGLIEQKTGKLIYKGIDGKLNADSYIDFLKYFLQTLNGKVIIIHDGAPYHRSAKLKEFSEKQERLTFFRLPSYSPDFNPIEGLWKKVKKKATHLMYFSSFEELVSQVNNMMEFLSQNPSEVKSLFGFYNKLGPKFPC